MGFNSGFKGLKQFSYVVVIFSIFRQFFIYLYAIVAPNECFAVNKAEGAGGASERAWNREVAIQSG